MRLTCQLHFEKWYHTYFSDKYFKRFGHIPVFLTDKKQNARKRQF